MNKKKQYPGLPLALKQMREESPGSTGRSTSENGSHWRQWARVEENNRLSVNVHYMHYELRGKGEKVR